LKTQKHLFYAFNEGSSGKVVEKLPDSGGENCSGSNFAFTLNPQKFCLILNESLQINHF